MSSPQLEMCHVIALLSYWYAECESILGCHLLFVCWSGPRLAVEVTRRRHKAIKTRACRHRTSLVRADTRPGLRPVGLAAFSRPGRNVYVEPWPGRFSESQERISQLLSRGMWGFSPPVDTSQEYMCYLNHRLNNDVRGHRDTHDRNKGEKVTQLWGLR